MFYAVHPGAHESDASDMLEERVFDLKDCCRSQCARRLVRVAKSVGELRRREPILESLKLVARKLRLPNMWSERQLAAYRSDRNGAREVETAWAKSFLGQVLREHLTYGRLDPRLNHREWLLQDSVPIRCRQRKKASKPAGPFLVYKSEAEAEFKASGGARNQEQHRQWLRDLGASFKELPQRVIDRSQQSVRTAHAQREVDAEDIVVDAPSSRSNGRAPETLLSWTSTDRTPCDTVFLEDEIQSLLELPPGPQVPGFTKYADTFRQLFADLIIAVDGGDIPHARLGANT